MPTRRIPIHVKIHAWFITLALGGVEFGESMGHLKCVLVEAREQEGLVLKKLTSFKVSSALVFIFTGGDVLNLEIINLNL